jgi:YndJ-like protein
VLLGAGPVVVVGLGLPLAERLVAAPGALRLTRRAQPVGAALAVVALALEPGAVAGLVACGWLAVCVAATGGGALLAWRRRVGARGDVGAVAVLTVLAGLAFLSVGGSWLVISRFGWRPLDLSTDIVRLTAVHFHYAGFALPVLGAAALRARPGAAARRVLEVACGAAVVGPPVVAAGFTTEWALLQVGGAVVVTVAAWGVAAGTAAEVVRSLARDNRGAALLLGLSSVSPLVAMVLAVQWALAQHAAIPALSVDDMARTHGLLNGLGFVIAGLAGWSLVEASDRRGAPLPSRR